MLLVTCVLIDQTGESQNLMVPQYTITKDGRCWGMFAIGGVFHKELLDLLCINWDKNRKCKKINLHVIPSTITWEEE